jgi:hypothetical protein
MSGATRLVVCGDALATGHLELPESRVDADRQYISGGERSLYELAVAGAVLGLDVELRGAINGPILEELTSAAGAGPKVGLEPRRPDRHDLVVIPEASNLDLLTLAVLSEARWVMYLLAPPGLSGWSFQPGWTRPDPMVVPIEAVGAPETFEAIDRLGFTSWTNAHGIAEAGGRSGVAVEWIGTGTPVPFPEVEAKTCDVAVVEANRWAPWAEQVLSELPGVTVTRIPATPSVYSLSAALAPARLLLWPSRLEGASRIEREARGVGTVPVTLNTNPFATAEDHGGGTVRVDDLHALAVEARALLDDPGRLDSLRVEAVESVARQTEWGDFVARVGAAISALPTGVRPGADVADALGRHGWQKVMEERQSYMRTIGTLQAHSSGLEETVAGLNRQVGHLTEQRASLEMGLTTAYARLDRLDGDRSRLVETLAHMGRELDAARVEVEAHRSRLIIRLVDGSRLASLWRAVRPSGGH